MGSERRQHFARLHDAHRMNKTKLILFGVCLAFQGIIYYSYHEAYLTSYRYHAQFKERAENSPWRKIMCQKSETIVNMPPNIIPLPMLLRDVVPEGGNNIFMIETACNPQPSYRAWCAVESYSRMNPKADVWYVMTSRFVKDTDGHLSRLLKHYKNLRLVAADLETIFNGTALEAFFMSGRWHKGTIWPAIQLSDMMRVALVWHWGGFYTDTDTVCLKDVSPLRNFVIYSSQARNNFANGVFHFDKHHEFLHLMMKTMTSSFKPLLWGSMGPLAVRNTVRRVCNVTHLNTLIPRGSYESKRCGSLVIMPEDRLLPYSWEKFSRSFQPLSWEAFYAAFQNRSYAFHTYGKLNSKSKIEVGSGSIYEEGARRFCSITYLQATANSSSF